MSEAVSYLRPKAVAARLGVSRQTVERRFRDRPGVIRDGRRCSTRTKRAYAMMLIPQTAVEDYIAEHEQ